MLYDSNLTPSFPHTFPIALSLYNSPTTKSNRKSLPKMLLLIPAYLFQEARCDHGLFVDISKHIREKRQFLPIKKLD